MPKASAEPKFQIVDSDEVPVTFVDWFITHGEVAGVVNLTLGTLDTSLRATSDDPYRVLVGARLRMGRDFAQRLHSLLGEILNPSEEDGSPAAPNKSLN